MLLPCCLTQFKLPPPISIHLGSDGIDLLPAVCHPLSKTLSLQLQYFFTVGFSPILSMGHITCTLCRVHACQKKIHQKLHWSLACPNFRIWFTIWPVLAALESSREVLAFKLHAIRCVPAAYNTHGLIGMDAFPTEEEN
jgi:hypothetical protein